MLSICINYLKLLTCLCRIPEYINQHCIITTVQPLHCQLQCPTSNWNQPRAREHVKPTFQRTEQVKIMTSKQIVWQQNVIREKKARWKNANKASRYSCSYRSLPEEELQINMSGENRKNAYTISGYLCLCNRPQYRLLGQLRPPQLVKLSKTSDWRRRRIVVIYPWWQITVVTAPPDR